MARIRTVKPMLFRHEGLFEAERDYQLPLRFAFIGLLTCCDREGRFQWRPSHLKLDIFPYDDIDIVRILEALVTRGFIQKYQGDGKWYGCIPSWHKHQCIDHHEMQSDCPDPPGWVRPLTVKRERGKAKPAKDAETPQPKKGVVQPQEIEQSKASAELPMVASQNNLQSTINLSPLEPLAPQSVATVPVVSLGELQAADRLQALSKSQLNQPLSTPSSYQEPEHEKAAQPSSHAQTTPANPVSDPGLSGNGSSFFGFLQKCPGMPGGNMEYGIGNMEYGNKKSHRVIPTLVESKIRQCGGEPIQQVFEYWKTVMKHPNAKLDLKRRRLISKALKSGYQLQELCQAIQGCSVTPHNMGDNDRGQRYDGLHVIFRDADQIERFIHHAAQPPRPIRAADRHTQGNIFAAQRWIEKKMQESKTYAVR